MSSRIHAALRDTTLSLAGAAAHVADPRAGATVTFTGVVRDHADERAVSGLDYSAYEEVAAVALADLATAATERWPQLLAVWVEHRVGELVVGDLAVVVATAAPHRAEAFDAARWLIDTLKEQVPIWKHEHWADGGSHWPEPARSDR